MGERKRYGSGRAEELPEGAAVGARVRALGHSSRVSGSVTGGGGDRREGACAGPLLSGERKRYGRG